MYECVECIFSFFLLQLHKRLSVCYLSFTAAFLGDIALDEDDLLMFKEVHNIEGARHTVLTNQTDSGIKVEISLPLYE